MHGALGVLRRWGPHKGPQAKIYDIKMCQTPANNIWGSREKPGIVLKRWDMSEMVHNKENTRKNDQPGPRIVSEKKSLMEASTRRSMNKWMNHPKYTNYPKRWPDAQKSLSPCFLSLGLHFRTPCRSSFFPAKHSAHLLTDFCPVPCLNLGARFANILSYGIKELAAAVTFTSDGKEGFTRALGKYQSANALLDFLFYSQLHSHDFLIASAIMTLNVQEINSNWIKFVYHPSCMAICRQK